MREPVSDSLRASVAGECGIDALRDELREMAFRRPGIHPDCHSRNYHSEMLSGVKPLRAKCLEGFLDRIVRSHGSLGREMVRRLADRWIGRYAMFAGDAASPDRIAVLLADPVKSIDEEQLEACIAVSEFHVRVDEAQRLGDPAARRAAKRAGDRAKSEIADVQRRLAGGCA